MCLGVVDVRKHPAPQGALRLPLGDVVVSLDLRSESTQHHKVH